MTTIINTLVAARAYGKVNTSNSAMPGSSFALPTGECITGAILSAIEGSVCHGCYAKKSEAMYPSVRKGWASNYEKATRLIVENLHGWVSAVAFQIQHHCEKLGEPYHRWFDSGDLQYVDMLKAIVLVCEKTPNIRHWLPTREATIVKQWRAEGGEEPANLVIRISSTMIGDAPRRAPHTSTVHYKGTFDETVHGHDCPKANHTHATRSCENCRNCWDKAIANVSYQFHR